MSDFNLEPTIRLELLNLSKDIWNENTNGPLTIVGVVGTVRILTVHYQTSDLIPLNHHACL